MRGGHARTTRREGGGEEGMICQPRAESKPKAKRMHQPKLVGVATTTVSVISPALTVYQLGDP